VRKRLGDSLEKNIAAFDGIEYCHFYYKSLSYNAKAVQLAKKHKKPIIGTGDVHRLYQQGHTYTMIDAKPERGAVFDAIKKGKVELVTKSLPLGLFLKHGVISTVT
jgi:predicted metal-dependent phosphoesterase TrpH